MKNILITMLAITFAAAMTGCNDNLIGCMETVDGVTWYYNVVEGEAVITFLGEKCYSYEDEYSGALIIPAKIGKYKVTKIGDQAFYGCKSLESITIPNSVTKIGREAFEGCSSLKMVYVKKGDGMRVKEMMRAAEANVVSVKFVEMRGDCVWNYTVIADEAVITSLGEEIDSYANEYLVSYENEYLVSLILPSKIGKYKVTKIGERAFWDFKALESIMIPDSVTEIGEEAFVGCSSLTSITIPNSVTEIGEWAFDGCEALESITIPNSVTEIGVGAFKGCSSLKSIAIPNGVTKIGDGAFYGCKSLESITIPNSVTEIGVGAFYGCKSLESITIPNSVTEIGVVAFYVCRSLESITIPDSVTKIGREAFEGCSSLKTVYVKKGDGMRVKEMMRDAEANVESVKFVEM